jgi:hypothetical protein
MMIIIIITFSDELDWTIEVRSPAEMKGFFL